MHKLGVSIYPKPHTQARDKEYLRLASKYGVKRVFSCLLSVELSKEEVKVQFTDMISYANSLGMEVIIDIAPRVLKALNIDVTDLSFFNDLGVYGVRLDMPYGGLEEARMTHNEYGLKLEINMSSDPYYVDKILEHNPNRENLLGSHNFYPHRYAGLSEKHWYKCSKLFKGHGLRTAAFVSSAAATFGPWQVMEGLCTLEMHRELPIEVQAKHFFFSGLIDDVLISNAYASEEEFQKLSSLVNTDKKGFPLRMHLHDTITPLEKKIVLEEEHFYRSDVSPYFIRSTQSRVKYKQEAFPPTYTPDVIRRGDILIDNVHYGQYKGELQIAIKDMENSGKTNVVGRIVEEEIFLLDYIQPNGYFFFTEA